jgi:GAF domain-containing protein
LEQQTATSEVLQVISSSPGDLEPVFTAMLENAVRICDATFGNIYRWDGNALHLVGTHNTPPAFAEARRRLPIRPDPRRPLSRMLATKTTVHVPDLTAELMYAERDPAMVLGVELGGIRTLLLVPMLNDNELSGAFTLSRKEVRPFTDRQVELVKNFAAQAVIAIENTRLLNELRESLERQTATAEVLQLINSSPGDLDPVFDAMLEKAMRLCEATFGGLTSYDGERFHTLALRGLGPEAVEAFREPWTAGPGSHHEKLVRGESLVHTELNLNDEARRVHPQTRAVFQGGARYLLLIGLRKDSVLLGSLWFYRKEVRPYSDKQVALLQNFGAQAVIAMENARLLSNLRQRTDELGHSVSELRALGDVSHAVNSTLDLETVLSTIVGKAVQLSGTEAGAIYVIDDPQSALHLRATYGMDRELIDTLAGQRIGLDEGIVAQALAQREPVQIPDLKDQPPSAVNDIILRAGFRALLVAPLLRGEEIVGTLVVRRRAPGSFPQNTVDLIKTFAAQSAVAIQNAKLFDGVETRTRELANSLDDLRTTQDRLVQTQKLASLGQLTAGIAHEIKNPLNFVNNFSGVSVELIDELQQALEAPQLDIKARAEIAELANTLRGNLDKIVQHGKRADAIVKNMLLHSREGSGEHRPVNVNGLVEESLNLAYHGARAEKQGFTITLERSFDPTAGEFDVFPQEITRALLNLISNGFYAATKRSGQTTGDGFEPTVRAATKNLGDRVEIRIRDNGAGIPPEVREKMFNLFLADSVSRCPESEISQSPT